MNLDGIRSALRQQPFQPFELRLTDGRTFPVVRPEFVAIGTRQIGVIGERDSWSLIEPESIISIDSLSPRNGGDKRRRRERPPRA